MKTPENGQIGHSPSHEGKELTPPQGFSIRIENPDLIFKAIEKGVSGEIGRHALESPINEVDIDLIGGKDRFNFVGEIVFNLERNRKEEIRIQDIKLAVAEKFLQNGSDGEKKIIERGDNIVVTAPRGTKFILGETSLTLGRIIISTGWKPTTAIKEGLQVIPPPYPQGKVLIS